MSDVTILTTNQKKSQAKKLYWANRKKKFDDQYGHLSVGAYQTAANPTASFRDWKVDPRSLQVVAHTDYLQPEFLIHRIGGSMVLREANILKGEASLAQDCKIPVRDENGFLVEYSSCDEKAA